MMRWISLFLMMAVAARAAPVDLKLREYREELNEFRAEYGGARELPNVRFFLFGMGLRPKYLYRDGKLIELKTGIIARQWKIKSDIILPSEYGVFITTEDGSPVEIVEDGKGIWIAEGGPRLSIKGSEVTVKLPSFEPHKYARVLRVLHHELLINVTQAGPVPNFFVYKKPWYRDGAMMAMVFQKTGNMRSIRNWIMHLSDPFDRNNGGETEADNLGQALYLISLASDKKHPLVTDVLAAARKFEEDGVYGKFIKGRSDFAEHPVYQTKWLKFGLRALSLTDSFVIPEMADSYSALFWMDFKEPYVITKDSDDRAAYPYLGWACDHFHRTKKSPISNRDYPLTWEQRASQADYNGLALLDPIYIEQKLAAPHTWHAAEILLYLLDQK